MHRSATASIVGAVFRLLQVGVGVVGEQHPRGQHAVRVDQVPCTARMWSVIGRAPLALDEGRDVAPRAVLGLQRPVELLGDHGHDVAQEGVEPARSSCRVRQRRRDEEVQVARRGVAEDDSRRTPCRANSACSASAPSASRSGGKQTSSRMNDVPLGRAPPTLASSPLRITQYCAAVRGVAGEVGRLEQRQPGEDASAAALGRRGLLGGRVAELHEQRGRRLGQLVPALGNARAAADGARSRRGRAARRRPRRPPRTVRPRTHAACMSGKIISEVRVLVSSGTVSNTASAMNPSVPSEPTMSRRRICTGRLGVEEGLHRVAGRVLDAVLGADPVGDLRDRPGSRRGSRSSPSAIAGSAAARRSSASGAAVSTTVPEGSTNVSDAQRPVGVLDGPAAHPAGVVGDRPRRWCTRPSSPGPGRAGSRRA